MQLVEKEFSEYLVLPKDINGAAQNSPWLDIHKYRRCGIILQQGAWAGGTPAVTLQQAQDVSGTGAKALNYGADRWQKNDTGVYVRTAIVSNTWNLPNNANYSHFFQVDAADLDTTNGFKAFRVQIASPGAFSDLLAVLANFHEPVYPGASMQDPKVN